MWRLSRGSSLIWKAWDDEYVVFNAGSGNAHLLDALTGEVLKGLESVGADAGQLVRALAADLGIDPTDQLERGVDRAIGQLHLAGLIERVTP